MSKPPRKSILCLIAGLCALGAALPAWAQQEPTNLLAGAGFELDPVSLRLPALSPFPIVVGGWGARGDAAAATTTTIARAGLRALEIVAAPNRPAHVLQDTARGTPGFEFHASVQRRRGQQSIALLGAWTRMDPAARALVRLELRAARIRVTTRAGAWTVPAPLADRAWHRIGLRADPRTGLMEVRVDGVLQGQFPGALEQAVHTVMLGSDRDATPSAFRYDELALTRLPEIELLALRDDLAARGAPATVLHRLDVALQALENGSPAMMAAELRVAARQLAAQPRDLGEGRLSSLIALVTQR